jgi:enoyl-[acyl-carrier protein] reductase II
MMRLTFTEQYGIAYPIVQSALGVVSMPALVAAVSEAGGMGTLSAVGPPVMSAAALRKLIEAVRTLTAFPFGVNFNASSATDQHLRVCIEEQVSVVSFCDCEPPESKIDQLRSEGISVWLQAGSVAVARRAVRAGADAVIAQGSEAGGANCGASSVMTLVPAIVDAVAPVPVLAGGGIADGRGLAAALALGADAVWAGTRFLASREANAHPEYKRRVVAATDGQTRITRIFAGPDGQRRSTRVLRNRLVETWQGREDDAARAGRNPRIIGCTELGDRCVLLHEFSAMVPTPETTADFDELYLPAGESAALVHEVLPAAEIIRRMVQEARQVVKEEFAALESTARIIHPNGQARYVVRS